MRLEEMVEQETFEPFVKEEVNEVPAIDRERQERMNRIKARFAERARHDDLWNDLYFLLFDEEVERA